MNASDRDKYLDQLISKATGGDEHRFKPDFNKWLEDHPDAARRLSALDEHAPGNVRPCRDGTRGEPLWIRFPRLTWVCGIAAGILITVSSAVSVILARKVASLERALELAKRDVVSAEAEEPGIINFYVQEHQDVVARHAALSPARPEPMQMRVSQDDILYYELLDDQPETMRPGIIVRGPSSQGPITASKAPIISNGHTLTLSQAKETAGFVLRAPARLHPGYALDQIRNIQDRDALQLLYSNGINSISLFEQPLDGRRKLEPGHFREYAVYRKEGQAGGIILAWRDDALSYVLIGNATMSQLMDMAQSIGATR